MIRKIQYIPFFLVFILLFSCSFHKGKIWSGSKDEQKKALELELKQNEVLDVIKIYSSQNLYTKEIQTNKKIFLTNAKKNLSWEMSSLNYQNSLGNIYSTGIDINFLKKKIGKNKFSISRNAATPLIINKSIILADDTGTIFKATLKGKIKWKKNIYKKVYKKVYKNLSYSVYKGKIYVADNIGFIYQVSLETGEVLWIKNHGTPLKSNVKVFGDKIYLINQDNRLICLNAKDGSLIWDVRSISSFIKSQNFLALAVSEDGYVVMLSSSGDLLKVKSDNGKIYWSVNTTGTALAHGTDFFRSSDIVLIDNDIIFTTSEGIFSYNSETGYLNWMQKIGAKNTPIIDKDNMFLVTDNGYFINLDKETGEIIASTNVLKILKKKKQNTYISGFIMGSGKIYSATLNGYLIVLSATTGKVETVRKIGDSISAAPIISNGSLYILTTKSRIFGFK